MFLSACHTQSEENNVPESEDMMEESGRVDLDNTNTKEIILYVGVEQVDVIWEDNESINALKDKLQEGDIEVEMSMYGGFEQVGALGFELPRNDAETTTTSGDIVLYSGNQIVMFYGSNSWAYTRLGKIQASNQEIEELFANGDVTIKLSCE